MPKTKTPPEILREKQPVVKELARALKLSRFQTYGLIDPVGYPDAIPAGLFDTRSDIADRVAAFIECPVETLRHFYAKAKAA